MEFSQGEKKVTLPKILTIPIPPAEKTVFEIILKWPWQIFIDLWTLQLQSLKILHFLALLSLQKVYSVYI